MAILKIARMGHPVLRTRANPIDPSEIGSPEIEGLIEDMLDTCEEYQGIGLAAPQVHVPLKIVILEVDDSGPTVWFNPEIQVLTEERIYTYEGCLSVPGIRGLVGRPSSIRVQALDREGNLVDRTLDGFPAVVAQHEIDHLDGIIYVDKVTPGTLTFLEEHHRYANWDRDENDDGAEMDAQDDPTAPRED